MKQQTRKSHQREVILEELRQMTSHPTADDIYQLVRKRIARISLGTVYRNLELLSRHGLIRKLHIAGNQMRFDGSMQPHFHIICERCFRVEDIDEDDLSLVEVDHVNDYVVTGVNVELTGICPKCRGKKDNLAKHEKAL
ncbi:transcriptional repressor [bacterium]|nr:transcriptional repressor [candidate division CSSED10-310 bacterium]